MKLFYALLGLLVSGAATAQSLTPTGIGDLPSAASGNPTDTYIVCQSQPCHAGTQLNSIAFNKFPIFGTPPITYNPNTGAIGLAIDSTLSVVGGALHVVGGGGGGGISSITFSAPLTGGTITTSGTVGLTVPNAALLTGNGTTFGGMTLGTNLSVSGSFPTQTLNASGGGTTIPNAAIMSGNGSVLGSVALGTNLSLSGSFPTQTLNATGGGSGFTGGITVASACTGASCTPVTSCMTYSTGSLSGFASGACSGTNFLLINTGSKMLINTGSSFLIQ